MTILTKNWLVFCVVLLAACGEKPAATMPAGATPPPAEVEVMTVVAGDATLTQDLPGRLQAYRSAQVRARGWRD